VLGGARPGWRRKKGFYSSYPLVALAPHWPQGFFTLARHYEVEEREADALQTYSRGLALDPSNAQARNNYEKLAIKMALAQDKPVVLALGADQKVEIDPHSATSYYQLGLRYLRNDEAEAAGVALQQAIALQPGSDVAHLFLGLAYTSLGTHARAEAAYHRTIALRPTNPHAYNYLGLTYHQQQRYREALAAYRQALQYDANLQAVQAKIDALSKQLGQ
jgi:Tfp pilus assembly protein PilF